MEKNEIKDRLFDVLSDTNNLPIQGIIVEDRRDIINVYFTDGIGFLVHVENCGNWCIYEV